MQIDNEYIAMIDTPEIQGNLPELKVGDWVVLVDSYDPYLVVDLEGYHALPDSITLWCPVDCDTQYWNPDEVIRIPTLEDLWGMCHEDKTDYLPVNWFRFVVLGGKKQLVNMWMQANHLKCWNWDKQKWEGV